VVYSSAGKTMSKIMKGKYKDMPRSRISEAVWAAVIGMAATHTAQADEANKASEENNLQKDLDALGEAQKGESAAIMAMAAARHASEENIIGDGTTVEHSGEEEGQVVEAAQAAVSIQTNNEQVENSETIAGDTATVQAQTTDVQSSEGLLAANISEEADLSAAAELDMNVEGPAGPIVSGLEFDAGLLGFLGVAAVGAIAYASSDSDDDDAAPVDTATPLEGVAVDGYVAGATVWADKNGDGQMTSDETTVTDSNGNFSFDDVDEGTTVTILAGGRDVMTGEIVETNMVGTAESGADIVVSPLTTLLAAGADEAELKEALGLDASIDLATFDPIEAINSDNAAEQGLGESVFVAAQQVMTALQAGVAATAEDTGTVDAEGNAVIQTVDVSAIAADLATSINSAETTDFAAAVTEALDSDVAVVVNNVNVAIEESLEGNLVAALTGDSFQALSDVMDVVAVAQTEVINSVETASLEDAEVEADTWTAETVAAAAEAWTPDLNEENFDFLVDQGLSLAGADIDITDAEVLDAILSSDTVDVEGANITLDEGIQGEDGDIEALQQQLADSTGTEVVVDELGDY
jgi:hypothetical protein